MNTLRVVIEVSGGVAEAMTIPPGVEVVILDWDNCAECGGADCGGGWDADTVHGQVEIKP